MSWLPELPLEPPYDLLEDMEDLVVYTCDNCYKPIYYGEDCYHVSAPSHAIYCERCMNREQAGL